MFNERKNQMKKLTSILIAGLFLTTNVHAYIYEDNSSRIITEGITHRVSDTFSQDGWVRADIVTIDLTNPDLSLKVLTSPNGTSSLATEKSMAQSESTKVAVNADFFNMQSGETNMLGMLFKDGELLSTPSKDNFVSFAVTEENRVLFDYFTFQGTLYAENTSLTEFSSCELYQINKVPLTTGAITMITSAWGENVTIPMYTYAMICENAGEDKYQMTAFSWGGEKVAIPQGGAVFIANYSVNAFLNANFAIGDTIRVETKLSPDITGIKEASGGNTLLVKNGEIVPFTSNITGKAQRTAMGLDKSGETLFLVTVDGRDDNCPGFTQDEMAQFMLNLGVNDAINLDGGGSTTLVAPDTFTNEQKIINNVSSPRKVSTAIGVVSSAESGEALEGEIKLSKDTIILGDQTTVSYAFFDEKYNPVTVDLSKVKISCSDEYAVITENSVMPTKKGVHTITAEYDGIILREKVEVLGDIFAINIYPENVSVTSGDKTFTVTAYDKNGKAASVPENLLTFTASGDITLSGSTVKKGEGSGIVTASYENLTSNASVNSEPYLRPDDIKTVDTFEGFIKDGVTLTITGEISEPKNLISRFMLRKRLSDLAQRDDVYVLSDNIHDPRSIFTAYRKTDTYTHRIVDNTAIITIPHKNSSILKTEKNAWDNFQITLDMIEEKNLLIITNDPIYNLNTAEQTVWDYYMKRLTDKGINVFVASMGEKSEATVKNSVRYLYVGDISTCSIASCDYSLKSSAPLTITISGDDFYYTYD